MRRKGREAKTTAILYGAAADGGDGCKAPSISLNSVAARMLHIPK